MILLALRILFGGGLAYGFIKIWQNAQAAPQSGDLTYAFYLALCVILGIANAVVWAPYFADTLSGPLTGVITKSTYVDRKNYLLLFVHWLENHRLRRSTLLFCFLEGVHHPSRPTAFVIGLKNAKPGSWLEKVYAREVFKFDNARHCLLAYEGLKRHGIDPRPHRNPEINGVLVSIERQARPEAEPVVVPPASPAPPLKRDGRIKLFDRDEPRTTTEVTGATHKAADEGTPMGGSPGAASTAGQPDRRPPAKPEGSRDADTMGA